MKSRFLTLLLLLGLASIAIGAGAFALSRSTPSVGPRQVAQIHPNYVSAGNRNAANASTDAVASGQQPAAFARQQRADDALPPGLSITSSMKLDGPSRLVATWSSPGQGHAYLAQSSQGNTCIVLVRDDLSGAAGCNSTENPFAGKPFFWTSGTEGGPSPEQMSAYEVVGVARPDVARIELSDSSGRTHDLLIDADGGFAFSFPAPDLQAGIVPHMLNAYGPDGQLLGSEQVHGN